MRVERLAIRGFGRLVDREYEFAKGRAALILEDNESGKSTLAAAILAALCGFPKRRQTGEVIKQSDVYAPWESEYYSVEMDIDAGGLRLRVERDFSKGSFTIRDRDTNRDISASFEQDLTYQFLRLSRDDFRRMAFVSGKEVTGFSSSPDIQARLSALVDGSQNDASADKAIAALLDVKYPLSGRLIKTETASTRILSAIEDKQRRLRQLEESLDAAGEEARRLEEAQEHYSELMKQLDQLDIEYRTARLLEVREKIKSASSTAGEVTALQAELAELESTAGFPVERAESLFKAVERMKERTGQMRELRERADRLREQTDDFRIQLDSIQQFSAGDEDELVRLGACESEFRNAADALRKKQEEIERELRALKAEGIDPAQAVEMESRIELMTDDDRGFVRAYGEAEARSSADITTAEAARLQAESELKSIQRKRSDARRTGTTALGIGLVCGTGFLSLMILGTLGIVGSISGVVAGILVAAYGLVQMARAASIGADEKARLEREILDASSRAEIARAKRGELEQRVAQLARKFKFNDASELIRGFRDSEQILGRSDVLNTLRAQATQANSLLQSASQRAFSILRRLGIECGTDDLLEELGRAKGMLSKYLDMKRKRQEVERELSIVSRSIEDKSAGVDEEKKIIGEILTDAGVDAALPLEDALSRFRKAETRCKRYRQIRDMMLPAAAKHAAPEGSLVKLLEEESDLARQLNGLETGSELRPSSGVETERQSVRRKAGSAMDEVREMERNVGTLVDTYKREYPPLQEEIETLRREAERVTRFEKSIDTAAKAMKEVAESSHRRWAVALNEQASMILPHLNPDYADLRFDDSLEFTVRRISDGRIIEKAEIDTQLSTGAKDQIYLAVRLACCAELSRLGESIPIILDDPLIAADDTRFRQGFRYIVEALAKEHQVIILSCHKSRHEDLSREKWFCENVSVMGL